MPYSDDAWEYFSKWENYSKEKDLNYSYNEFQYFLNRIKNNNPFSLVRFGEGESRIILKEQNLNRTELSFNPKTESSAIYAIDLENVAKINHKNYFVGIQSYTYRPGERDRPLDEFITQRKKIIELGNLPKAQYTCSRIFCNFFKQCNTDLLDAIKQTNRNLYYVSSSNADPSRLKLTFKKMWKISPKDAWKKDINLYNEIKQTIDTDPNSFLICSAGFFGNILISKLNHDNNFLINVGSVFDPTILNRITRGYQRDTT
jgi:hypothetical protein